MINPMDWIELLITLGVIIATATAIVIGIRVQQMAQKEATAREFASQRREIQLLQMEAKECRERIDNVLGLLAKSARQPEKD